MIINELPYNSLLNSTKELFRREIISKIINNYKINCKSILILDNTASKLISKFISLSDVINQGIFSIESIYKKRKPYKNFSGIYIISGAESSINLVIKDFKSDKNRLYKFCHLFILDKITNNILENLLNKKFIRRILTLKEVRVNYTPIDKNLFFFGNKGNFNSLYQLFYNNNPNDPQNKFFNKIQVTKICSICKVTKTFPYIVYFKHDPNCIFISEKINKNLTNFFKNSQKNGVLLITSRKMDLVAPIVFDLTYEHLLFELYKSYDKKEKNSCKFTLEEKEYNSIFDYADKLYDKYKSLSLYQVMTLLPNDLQNFLKSDVAKIEKTKNMDSLEEMGDAMKNISEYKYLNPLYNTHLKLIEDINKKCQSRNIMDIIDLQSTIISGANAKGKKKGASHISKKILENKKKFDKNDFFRLLCIIKYYNPESDINSLIDIIESENININNNEKQIINFFTQENSKLNSDVIKYIDKFIILHRNKCKYNTQEEIDNKDDKRYLCIKESKLTTICDMCSKNELPTELFEFVEKPENIPFDDNKYQANLFIENNVIPNREEEIKNAKYNLIFYNVGGLSNFEIGSIDKANNIGQFGFFNIIYGGNKIYNYEEYFQEIENYLDGKDGILYEDVENPDEYKEEEVIETKNKKENKRKNKKKKNNEISIEMKNMKEDEKEINDETDKEKPKKKEKKGKKKKNRSNIEMNKIDDLEEPLNRSKGEENEDNFK